MTRYTATNIRTDELVAVDELLAVKEACKAIKKPGRVAIMVSEKVSRNCSLFICTKIQIVHAMVLPCDTLWKQKLDFEEPR